MTNINDLGSRLTRNAIECAHCGHVLESTHRHDWRSHECQAVGKISQSFDHELGKYVADYPKIFVDGGLAYVRIGGDPQDYIDRCEYDHD